MGVILVPEHESVSRVPLFPRDSQSHRWPDVGLFQLASFDCLLHSLVCLCAISSFLQSLDSQIVCLPSTIYHWIHVYHSTQILRYTQFMGYMSCILYLIHSRLCWCLTLILILVFSSALPWLTHNFLVEPILKLPLLRVAQPCACCKCYTLFLIYAHLHLLWVSVDFGEWWSYFVHVVSKYKTK